MRILGVLVHGLYDVRYENTEVLDELQGKGFVLLSSHPCPRLDEILEGILLFETQDRMAYQIMRSGLPKFYELLGGIKITRAQDLRTRSRNDIHHAKARRDGVYSFMERAILQGEIVVMHPEGESNGGGHGNPKQRVLKRLTSLRDEHGASPFFVPLEILYPLHLRLRSPITLRVGTPIQTHDPEELREHLEKEIALFSCPE